MIKVLFNFLFSIIQLLFLAFIPAEIEILEQPSNSKHTDSSEQQTISAEIETEIQSLFTNSMVNNRRCSSAKECDLVPFTSLNSTNTKV